MKMYIENDTRISSIQIGNTSNVELPHSRSITLDFPAESHSDLALPLMSSIEYAVFGGGGRLYALVGFIFEPDMSDQLHIKISIHVLSRFTKVDLQLIYNV